ncbi:hypothetical protein HU200_063406 [Digitaria exilis]|uniref:BTB domain-containing protein n=1 Tax=Digitaria exilis TaxID=1010633 RepID=A0A835DV91_9POAL|nr:hypothetical protein HU200_063406 [Digitaria exilis]
MPIQLRLCVVDGHGTPRHLYHTMTVECAIPVPASVLSRNLVELLRSKAGADVTFIVSGESIVAHKGVLAVRSPVFITEFFGEMKKESRHVEIKGMDARVFNAILGFIYTDAGAPAKTALAQHLLVAADRYGLDRLNAMCEHRLALGIDVGTILDRFNVKLHQLTPNSFVQLSKFFWGVKTFGGEIDLDTFGRFNELHLQKRSIFLEEGRDVVEEFLAAEIWPLGNNWKPFRIEERQIPGFDLPTTFVIFGLTKPADMSEDDLISKVEWAAKALIGPLTEKEKKAMIDLFEKPSRLNRPWLEMGVKYGDRVKPSKPQKRMKPTKTKLLEAQKRKSACVQQSASAPNKKPRLTRKSKTAVDRLRFLEKENERLREVNDKLRKDLTKIEDEWDTTDRKYKALQKDFDENLTVIENLRDAVVRESDAAKEAKTKVSSLELKLKETEDSLASSKTLDAEFVGLGDVFSIAGDNFALTCTDGLGRFLEKEDKELLLRKPKREKRKKTRKKKMMLWIRLVMKTKLNLPKKKEKSTILLEVFFCEVIFQPRPRAILLEVFFCEVIFQPRPRAILLELSCSRSSFCEVIFQPRPRAMLLELSCSRSSFCEVIFQPRPRAILLEVFFL